MSHVFQTRRDHQLSGVKAARMIQAMAITNSSVWCLHIVFIFRHCPMSQCRKIKMSDSLHTRCNAVGVCVHAYLDAWARAGLDGAQSTVGARSVRA